MKDCQPLSHCAADLVKQEIKDPEDKKPSDWVDDSMMDDPEDKKPENWVHLKSDLISFSYVFFERNI